MSQRPRGPSEVVEVGDLLVLRPAIGAPGTFDARAIEEGFERTSAVAFAAGAWDRAPFGVAYGVNSEDLVVRLYDGRGSKRVDRLIEEVGRTPTRLLAANGEFILVTLHHLLRVGADGTIAGRMKLADGRFADAALLPVKECPLVTLVVSGAEQGDARLERRCLDVSFNVRSHVEIARSHPYRTPRLSSAIGRPMAVVVGDHVAGDGPPGQHEAAHNDWTLSTCDFALVEPRCKDRRISGVPFHVAQFLDGLQAVTLADGSVIAVALPKGGQSLWRGWYGPSGERPGRSGHAPLPTVPGGYTIGHRVLMTSAGDQVWTALAYMRVWGDKAGKGGQPHSAADMHISLYKEAAPR